MSCAMEEERKIGEIQFEWYGSIYHLRLYAYHYATNNNLAIIAFDDNDEEFDAVSVNLGVKLDENLFFVDTNNLPEIDECLDKQNIAHPTGVWRSSGYCTYPLYRLNEQ